MSENGAAGPKEQIRDLMARATLARVRGDREQAMRLAQQALVLDEENWEVHEFIGDVLMENNRGADALASYKRAWALNPKRVELETKVARAAVRFAARQDQMANMNAILEGRGTKEPTRKPAVAGLLSLLLPGLGQLYNWQVLKGAVLVVCYLVVAMITMYSSAARLKETHDYGALVSGSAVWIVLGLLLMIYRDSDAVMTARKTVETEKPKLM